MACTYKFAVLRLVPDVLRAESINVGLAVFRDRDVDIRVGEVLTRARALYPDLSDEAFQQALSVLRRLGSAPLNTDQRYQALSRVGSFVLGEPGHFTVEDSKPETYDAHVDRLMKLFVSMPRGPVVAKKASRLVTTIRTAFRREKVLANVGDVAAIGEHRVVPDWPLPTRPSLRADLALKNRIMRVCEIADLALEDDAPPPPALFSGVVTLDVAQREEGAEQCIFAYRAKGSKVRIDEALGIAEAHASMLVDWDKTVERETFIHDWLTAAKSMATH